MNKIVIEFASPDGKVLRNLDAGFEYIDAADIPWANAERPLRVSPGDTLFSEAIPLPDGLATSVRVAAKGVNVDGGTATVKARVFIEGVAHELTVRVASELKRLDAPITVVQNRLRRGAMITVPVVTDDSVCPRCGKELARKRITIGANVREFLGCSGYPDCRYSRDVR
jgi:hypothetical protein